MGKRSIIKASVIELLIFSSVAIIAAGLIFVFRGEEETRLLFFLFHEGQTLAAQICRIVFMASMSIVLVVLVILSVLCPEQAAKTLFIVSASIAIIAVALICVFLFVQGLPAMFNIGVFRFLTGTNWRPTWNPPVFEIFPMIVGSIYVTVGAIIIGVPVGIFAAVFMAEICPKPVYRILKPAVNLLAGIPSVVYGYFGMVVLVPFVRVHFGGTGMSVLTASILLGIMILPTIIAVSETALRAVPRELYEGAVALGASHERAVFGVVLPAAKSGVMSAIILGIGRAIGETMAVRMVAGNQPVLRAPYELLMGVRTLTTNVVMELGYAYGDHRSALIATGVVLFVFILIINTLFSLLNRKEVA